MTIGAQFATRNEVEVLRRKIERAISGAAIAQHIIDPGAVDAFTDLTDVPEDYAGAGNFLVRVAAAEDELEFVELMLADLADVYFPSGEPDIGDVLTYESGGWTSMPPGAGGALDDLSDVNAPAPVDQDVLTWDDGAGEWIAQVSPAGGAAYLDDLLDVYFPSGEPDIGDVLTYESGGWTSMPGGGALALDDLTDVDAITGLSDQDVLTWDVGSGLWIAQAPPAGGGGDFLVCQVFS
jgi:hypothetical protein